MKKNITHPKLYYDFKISDNKIELFYYGSQFTENGDRLSQSSFIKANFFSKQDLIDLNKAEYRILQVYIIRQEKVEKTYSKKKMFDKQEILKKSLSLMYSFELQFNHWFQNQNVLLNNV